MYYTSYRVISPRFCYRQYVSNEKAFSEWVENAKQLEMSRNALGGNAPVMANRLAREGCSVLLGMKMSESKKLPKGFMKVYNLQVMLQLTIAVIPIS